MSQVWKYQKDHENMWRSNVSSCLLLALCWSHHLTSSKQWNVSSGLLSCLLQTVLLCREVSWLQSLVSLLQKVSCQSQQSEDRRQQNQFTQKQGNQQCAKYGRRTVTMGGDGWLHGNWVLVCLSCGGNQHGSPCVEQWVVRWQWMIVKDSGVEWSVLTKSVAVWKVKCLLEQSVWRFWSGF
jgi:hypothetical protein